eukprot:GEMP01038455.1.p1 GENE.GEMP01038455.1~~GEMP01038455.1.p1  ORF type:complete len:390 (+),score=127.82 GEMP01038455.1:68-1171(+)
MAWTKKTDEQLATKLEQIWHGGSSTVCSTDYQPIDEEIERRNLFFIESEKTLFILRGAASANFEVNVLKKLKHRNTIEAMRLHPIGDDDEDDDDEDSDDFDDGDDDDDDSDDDDDDGDDDDNDEDKRSIPKKNKKVKANTFDFDNTYVASTSLLATYLPRLATISVMHMNICNFTLKALPSVEHLNLVDPQYQDDTWFLDLPNLKTLIMENTAPPAKAFAQSLVRCPRIEHFFSHKYWTTDNLPSLYLPHCTDFTFRRGDCVSKLHLYLPRVESLNLDANYSLSNVKLLKQGNAAMKEFNLPAREPPAKFSLSLINASLSPKAMKYFEECGRVLSYEGLEDSGGSDFDGINPMAGMDNMWAVLFGQR